MNLSFKQLLFLGIAIEGAVFALSYWFQPSIEDAFRYAARYSGRFSFAIFVFAFSVFVHERPRPVVEHGRLRDYVSLFAVMHLIHFGFLALSVYLNQIPLETVKVIGGAFAYLLIIVAPFRLHKVGLGLQLLYFYYVSLVMALTFVARIKGDFEGAAPSEFHYFGLGLMATAALAFGVRIYQAHKQTPTA